MSRFFLGAFMVDQLKGPSPCFEISQGLNYLGMVMQHPVTKLWAVTHNAYVHPNDRDALDRYVWKTVGEALRAQTRVFPDIHLADTACLEVLPASPGALAHAARQRGVDIEKLRRTANDPSKSEGVRNAAQRKLDSME